MSIIILLLTYAYYVFFVNRGIVIYDEGYYAHIAERILGGEFPYKDFFIQFPPGYFYLLALIYKIFGASLFSGRFLTLVICLGIVYLTILILNRFKVDLKFKAISILAIISFGFPLINNMSLLAWISVFLSLLAVFAFMDKKYVLLGIALSFLLFTKQNLGLYFLIVTNLFLIFGNLNTQRFKILTTVNGIALVSVFLWISYFFFLQGNTHRLVEFLTFNKQYLSVYPFLYPPLSMLLKPEGIFKLLPYYLPIVFALFFIKELFNKKKNQPVFYFSSISLVGFFGTVYPTSDLLHVYPFFGPLLVSSLLFFKNKKVFRYWRLLVLILVGIGFYLTLFKEYYRYQVPYRFQKVTLNLPKTQNIKIDQPLATDLTYLNLFITINTKKEDYIFSYPFSPMLYFILDRKNPSRFATYYPGYLTEGQEREVLNDIKRKNVRFVITFLDYKFNTPISKFIQKQNLLLEREQFKVFEIK